MTSVKPHDKLWCHIIIFESFANMFTDFYYVTLWDVHLEADFDWLLWQELKRTLTVASADDSLLRPASFIPIINTCSWTQDLCFTSRQQKHVILKVCLQVFVLICITCLMVPREIKQIFKNSLDQPGACCRLIYLQEPSHLTSWRLWRFFFNYYCLNAFGFCNSSLSRCQHL